MDHPSVAGCRKVCSTVFIKGKRSPGFKFNSSFCFGVSGAAPTLSLAAGSSAVKIGSSSTSSACPFHQPQPGRTSRHRMTSILAGMSLRPCICIVSSAETFDFRQSFRKEKAERRPRREGKTGGCGPTIIFSPLYFLPLLSIRIANDSTGRRFMERRISWHFCSGPRIIGVQPVALL